MKKANIILDNQSTGLTIMEKMDFDRVDDVFDTLHWAFHPECCDGDHPLDDRFLALWNLFLVSVGWSESEFWEEWDARKEKCNDCKATENDDKTPPEQKSN